MTIKKLQALKAKKRFTLVELIVVIAIIAVLAAILIPILLNWVTESNISAANGDAKVVFNAISAEITRRDSRGMEPIPGTVPTGTTPLSLLFRNNATTTGAATFVNAIVPEHLAQVPAGNQIRCWFDLRGAIVAVRITKGTVATADGDYVRNTGSWNTALRNPARGNIYGCFPVRPLT